MSLPVAWYRRISLALALVFAAAGCAFLLLPEQTLALFDSLGSGLGMAAGTHGDNRFFLILAAAYMYVVTALAWSMYRSPGERIYPILLCQGKWASAALSLAFFFVQEPMLIYLVNGVVDAALGLVVLLMIPKTREQG